MLTFLFLLALIPNQIVGRDDFLSANLQLIRRFDLNKVTFRRLHVNIRRFRHR